jgi:hypothetical protein
MRAALLGKFLMLIVLSAYIHENQLHWLPGFDD